MGWEEVGCCPVGLMTNVWGELIELKLWMVGLIPGWVVEVTMPLRRVDCEEGGRRKEGEEEGGGERNAVGRWE